MALACHPSILIADEPTTALDVTIQAQIIELIKDLRAKEKMAVIWITHDLAVVAEIADRVIVMYAGFIVEEADIFTLYDQPLHPYTRALIQSIPRVDSRKSSKLVTIPGSPPNCVHLPPGCPFEPRCQFRYENCRSHMPPLTSIAPDHQVACWVDVTTGRER
jgi:oligopeptide/dipeptide ABC transporter ATP-binding protein